MDDGFPEEQTGAPFEPQRCHMGYRVVALNARAADTTPERAPVGAPRAGDGPVVGADAAAGGAGAGGGGGGGSQPKAGVFLTKESLTFPGSTAAGVILLQLIGVFQEDAQINPWWALGVAVLLGAGIIFMGWPQDGGKRAIGQHLVVGVINTLLLAASMLGFNGVVGGEAIST